MSSVAKCLVLAGVALEADALLLQTGTTECKQHGCSGDNKAADGSDICKLYTVAKAFTGEAKKPKVADGATGSDKGKVKVNEVDYSCEEKECDRDGKKEQTTLAQIEGLLDDSMKEKITTACKNTEKKAAGKTDDKTITKADAKDLCDAIADLKKAGAKNIKKITKDDGSDPKSVSVTIGTAEPVSYKCAQTKQCNKTDGSATGMMSDVKAEDVDKVTKDMYADKVDTFDAMCKK